MQLLWLAGVQVDLINLLDLQMLQGNDEEDEGLDLATVATDHDVRPEVDGQEGDKFDSEFSMFLSSVFGQQYRNLLCLYTCLTTVLGHIMESINFLNCTVQLSYRQR